jgi:hypothetical protein
MSARFLHGTPLVWAGLLVTTSSCSLIYDADVFQYIDARPIDAMRAPDAAIPDAQAPDADPTRLALEQLDPPDVFEGAGCVPTETGCRSDSRPVPIVITGANIMPGATVTLNGPGLDGVTPDLVVNQDGTMAAFAVSVPVLPDLANGALGSIDVIVSQGGISESIVLPVRGLDDFVASVDAPGQTFAAASLRARYARIAIDAPVTFTGSGRVKLEATAELVVGAVVRVDGRNGNGQSGGAGGSGGCNGGGAQATGTCEGGGSGGGNGGGGGGGGHAESGESAGGAGGMPTGSASLTPLAPAGAATSRGHGGGGGGNCLTGTGGGGGGGGGSLELTSGGVLRLTATALLSARGGNGVAGSGLCAAGGGGGGSGGAILVRAALAFEDEGADTRANVDPGQGGSNGGNGSPGRVRFDLPGAAETPPAFAGVTHRYRGPVWDPASPVVTTEGALELRLFGGGGDTVFIDVEGQSRRELAFPMDSVVLDVPVNLAPGQSQICARVTNGPHANQPDAANCFDIAYIRLL